MTIYIIPPQPSSQENVNNLINSTGFYFNDDVEIEVERIKQGLRMGHPLKGMSREKTPHH